MDEAVKEDIKQGEHPVANSSMSSEKTSEPGLINDDLRGQGFTSPAPPLFDNFKKPDGMHYLDLLLENNKEASVRLDSQMKNVNDILKKHGASQTLGTALGEMFYKEFNDEAKKIHEAQTSKAQAEKLRIEAETNQRNLQESEEYRQKFYESERKENLEKTAEWQKARRLFDAKVAKGQQEFSTEKLGNLTYNPTVVKLAAELSDLRLAKDKNFFPVNRSPKEERMFMKEVATNLWNNL